MNLDNLAVELIDAAKAMIGNVNDGYGSHRDDIVYILEAEVCHTAPRVAEAIAYLDPENYNTTEDWAEDAAAELENWADSLAYSIEEKDVTGWGELIYTSDVLDYYTKNTDEVDEMAEELDLHGSIPGMMFDAVNAVKYREAETETYEAGTWIRDSWQEYLTVNPEWMNR